MDKEQTQMDVLDGRTLSYIEEVYELFTRGVYIDTKNLTEEWIRIPGTDIEIMIKEYDQAGTIWIRIKSSVDFFDDEGEANVRTVQ